MFQFFLSLMMMSSLMFNFLKHPLFLSMILFLQVILICLLMGVFSKTFWFSYILFLVVVGGILILFIYIVSLINQENYFLMNNKMFISYFMVMILIFLFSFFFLKLEFLNLIFFLENSLNLNKFYNLYSNFINILLVNYLFFMLIIVTKITKFNFGPFRMK